jgi:hypothetical protein
MKFAQKARTIIVVAVAMAMALPLAFSYDGGSVASTYPSTRIQRQPYQGGVSRTGILAPIEDNEYQTGARRGSLDRGARDQGSLDSGAYDMAPLGGVITGRSPSNFGATVDIGGTPMTTTSQLELLSGHAVAILVDKSTSMNEKDCPGHISRWRWCQEQAELFSQQTAGVLSERFTLAMFAHNYDIYPSVTLDQMRRLFEHTKRKIGTHPEGALREIFDAYFRGSMGQKPLVIAVISDGEPNDPEKVEEVIREATWQMKSPDQVSVTFLQVGHDEDGSEILREFDQQLRRRGAKYDIVDRKSFFEVQRLGLLGSLVASIKEHTPAPALVKSPKKTKPKPKSPALRPTMRKK